MHEITSHQYVLLSTTKHNNGAVDKLLTLCVCFSEKRAIQIKGLLQLPKETALPKLSMFPLWRFTLVDVIYNNIMSNYFKLVNLN